LDGWGANKKDVSIQDKTPFSERDSGLGVIFGRRVFANHANTFFGGKFLEREPLVLLTLLKILLPLCHAI
jgi:hypothetical protein